MKNTKKLLSLVLIVAMLSSLVLGGCDSKDTGKIEIELLQYKPEAVAAFEKIEEEFNKTHDNIHLTIQSPNEAMTILKTRFIRDDYPDIIGIGGDINYSNFLDADMFMDISDFEGVSDIKQAYMDIEDELEFVPTDGVYALPYVANAAGILYNRDMFEENGWKIPETWSEFINLCDTIKDSGVTPLYLGYKDTWTCLAPWNALAVGLAPSDTCAKVNAGKTTFSKEYVEVAVKVFLLSFPIHSKSASIGIRTQSSVSLFISVTELSKGFNVLEKPLFLTVISSVYSDLKKPDFFSLQESIK